MSQSVKLNELHFHINKRVCERYSKSDNLKTIERYTSYETIKNNRFSHYIKDRLLQNIF